jgi:pimeloyl-ACP methyl ester carboxylesterase
VGDRRDVRLLTQTVGSGEPVVFIHGALIADAFRPLLAERSLAHHRLVHYHRRGYGGSERVRGPTSVGQQVQDCLSVLERLGIDRAHVVGHSFGGVIALQLALDSPGVAGTLALLEPALMVGASAERYRESLRAGIERYRTDGAPATVDAFLEARWPGYPSPLEERLPGAFGQAVADAGTAFEDELHGLLAWDFGAAEARRIGVPTLCVLGGRSVALSRRFGETHQTLLEWLPRAEGVVVPDVAHLMTIEAPGPVADALAAFWARCPLRG